ncbi:MAG: HigA family addiction module antidote protein [Gammaproteobacteria bacterium]|nr:HigA family addiction module antidote protein [Gammaproteobacteria bacterium]MBT4811151.1 HigA family addiction module antidote protein [Thiotrichales bacterium]MBT3489523.1 HigA family addiction module antidote protein [Gammaproteobacteria bacterium]MBT3968413.1 HigA family addiction module antidote protein [Gammaproteobacteria bacterium]MBT4080336.1 HigA family addiction module antidote protein [Gammaproteobacteria bacterium]
MLMHNPPHPGQVIKELCLEPLKLTVTEAAKGLDVSRKTLSTILNGKAGITPEMAVRLSTAFNTSSESWINLQTQYDLWQAEQHRDELHEVICERLQSRFQHIPKEVNLADELIVERRKEGSVEGSV